MHLEYILAYANETFTFVVRSRRLNMMNTKDRVLQHL